MKYSKIITLKNGMECCLRNATESDGQLVLDNFTLTHTQTDYLLTYPDENTFDAAQESRILKEKENSENEIEIIAIIDGAVIGTAGIEAVGAKYKVRHRAEFGISVLKKFWELGIGQALMASCIELLYIKYKMYLSGEHFPIKLKFVLKLNIFFKGCQNIDVLFFE